jgi:hypothetical protein
MKKFLKIPHPSRPDIVISADDFMNVERHSNAVTRVFYSHGGKVVINNNAVSDNFDVANGVLEQMQQAVEDSVSPITELKSKKYYTVSVGSVVLDTDNPVAYSA